MIVDNVPQRSAEWHKMRLGHFTGSKIADLMKSGRKKDEMFSDTAKSYIYQVAGERLFNEAFLDDDTFQDYIDQTSFVTKAMQWGIDMEEQAKSCYCSLEENQGVEIAEVSSCKHDDIPFFAASPDGIVYNREELKCIEVKCPNLATHMRYTAEIHDGESLKAVKPEYYWQVMAEMSCTGASSTDFISYNPWITKPIHIVNIPRNEEDIKLLEQRVILANKFIEEIINK